MKWEKMRSVETARSQAEAWERCTVQKLCRTGFTPLKRAIEKNGFFELLGHVMKSARASGPNPAQAG